MINWAYVAGFFDGEGTLGGCGTAKGQSGKCRVFARMYQQNPHALCVIRDFLANQGIGTTIVTTRRGGFAGHPMNALNIPIRSIPAFLAGVRPYVLVKKQLVEDIARYLALYPAMTGRERGMLARETLMARRAA